MHLFILSFVSILVQAAESNGFNRREMNEFCARLPVDPHCPLIHTLNDIFSLYSFGELLPSDKVKPLMDQFCEDDNGSIVTLELLEETGGMLKLQKYRFCNSQTMDVPHFLAFFMEEVKQSSVTGYYVTEAAEYLAELLDVSYATTKSLDLKFRLKRADWLLKEAKSVIVGVSQKREEERTLRWRDIFTSFILTISLLSLFAIIWMKHKMQ